MYSLCCISNMLKPHFSFQSMTWSRYRQLESMYGTDVALSTLSDRWYNNVCVTHKTILHCIKNGWNYRISSSIFPLITHPDFNIPIEQTPKYNDIINIFTAIRQLVSFMNIRLSTHPDHFNVLATKNTVTLDKSIKELNHHGWFMDLIGCCRNHNSPINIHINNSRDTYNDVVRMLIDNIKMLDDSVSSRLVFENEDRGLWTISALHDHVYNFIGIPITYDNLHHHCNPSTGDAELCASTWANFKPLFHYSESQPNNPNIRAHAVMPVGRPPCDHYDWEIELKGKDLAIKMLLG